MMWLLQSNQDATHPIYNVIMHPSKTNKLSVLTSKSGQSFQNSSYNVPLIRVNMYFANSYSLFP